MEEEEEYPGALGTSASLALRLGQALFSITSLLFMCFHVQFYSYTSFWLVTSLPSFYINQYRNRVHTRGTVLARKHVATIFLDWLLAINI